MIKERVVTWIHENEEQEEYMEEDKKSYKGIRHQVLKRTPPAGGGERDTQTETQALFLVLCLPLLSWKKSERKERSLYKFASYIFDSVSVHEWSVYIILLILCCVRRSKRQPASSLLLVLILKENQNERHESQGEEAGGVKGGGGRFREEVSSEGKKRRRPLLSSIYARSRSSEVLVVSVDEQLLLLLLQSGVESDFALSNTWREHTSTSVTKSHLESQTEKRTLTFSSTGKKSSFPSSSSFICSNFLPSSLFTSIQVNQLLEPTEESEERDRSLRKTFPKLFFLDVNVNHISIVLLISSRTLSVSTTDQFVSFNLTFFLSVTSDFLLFSTRATSSFHSSTTRELHQWRYSSRLNSISHESTV